MYSFAYVWLYDYENSPVYFLCCLEIQETLEESYFTLAEILDVIGEIYKLSTFV